MSARRGLFRQKTHRSTFHSGDFGKVVLVVDAVSQHVAKVAQRPLQGVCRPFLLGLLERGSLPLAVLDVPIPNILRKIVLYQRKRASPLHESTGSPTTTIAFPFLPRGMSRLSA
jgi:hypothetical protein